MAEGSGFSQQYLSSLERGQYNPTIITIYELSLALETTYFSLILPEDTRGR
ncbi:helix-turn-helix transcriptional regulator [Brucella anthropi]|uniref:helix-turn-helix transcriptional regulator n=1 Tax=Brucella anthropi TaxID=529 RepID=UPI0031B819EB